MGLNKRLFQQYTKETKCLENIIKFSKEEKAKGIMCVMFILFFFFEKKESKDKSFNNNLEYMKKVYKKW